MAVGCLLGCSHWDWMYVGCNSEGLRLEVVGYWSEGGGGLLCRSRRYASEIRSGVKLVVGKSYPSDETHYNILMK